MSSLEFTCHIESVSDSLAVSIKAMVDAVSKRDAAALAQYGITTEGIPKNITLEIDSDEMVLSTSSGSEVELSFFDELVDALESAGATEYHARLFDSSSGGVLVWRLPHDAGDEIELDGADFLFLGDMEEERQEMLELAEDLGTVHDDFSEQVNLVVLGSNVDPEQLSRIAKSKIQTITEDQFWEYLSDQTM
ncbi:MAG: hypothetical protein D9N11_11015 [Ketobacter sp.]|nr:MAG: hypothetical protein D9N11_11015 [Ketobacter sp.]